MNGAGVIVGRFQVHRLHEEHVRLFEEVMKNHNQLVVVLGVPATRGSFRDPLDFEMRKAMIQDRFPSAIILPIPDQPSDNRWSADLDRRIREVIFSDVMLYGGRDSFLAHYTGGLPTTELEPKVYVSGTELRMEAASKSLHSEVFRAGVIWSAYHRYPTVYPTVDIAILREDEVLLARKPNESHWRFVGGFADVNSDSYEHDARREVFEETGLEIQQPTYIGSRLVDDWRYRQDRNKIKTMLFAADYVFGSPQPNDDVYELGWFPNVDGTAFRMVEAHAPLWGMFRIWYNARSWYRAHG